MKIILYGAGGHAKALLGLMACLGLELAYVVDDAPKAKYFGSKPVQRLEDFLDSFQENLTCFGVVLGMGNNRARERIYQSLSNKGFLFPSLIAPSAVVAFDARLSEACVVMPHVVINSGVEIGLGVILNSACVIEHECKIGSFAHIAPGAVLCGGVEIGWGCHIGARSVVIEQRYVGPRAYIGAGSVVINDIASDIKVVGNPAQKIITKGIAKEIDGF